MGVSWFTPRPKLELGTQGDLNELNILKESQMTCQVLNFLKSSFQLNVYPHRIDQCLSECSKNPAYTP